MDLKQYRFVIPILILFLISGVLALLIWSFATAKRQSTIQEPYTETLHSVHVDQGFTSASDDRDLTGMPVLVSGYDYVRREDADPPRERTRYR
ncbi:hypothetical protein QBC44DRAFT_371100 [Cladorrhinum sp. PSN332]|nr:hypothetical protein QBC44DRAFT_371100 [Cladorrhinum sp. PSN332]